MKKRVKKLSLLALLLAVVIALPSCVAPFGFESAQDIKDSVSGFFDGLFDKDSEKDSGDESGDSDIDAEDTVTTIERVNIPLTISNVSDTYPNGSILSWTAVAKADFYEVYCDSTSLSVPHSFVVESTSCDLASKLSSCGPCKIYLVVYAFDADENIIGQSKTAVEFVIADPNAEDSGTTEVERVTVTFKNNSDSSVLIETVAGTLTVAAGGTLSVTDNVGHVITLGLGDDLTAESDDLSVTNGSLIVTNGGTVTISEMVSDTVEYVTVYINGNSSVDDIYVYEGNITNSLECTPLLVVNGSIETINVKKGTYISILVNISSVELTCEDFAYTSLSLEDTDYPAWSFYVDKNGTIAIAT